MKRHVKLAARMLLAFIFTGTAAAALVDRGNGLIYDTDMNITWTQDANLLNTMMTSDPNLPNKISAALPGYIPVNPVSSGLTTWWGAQTFITYLNSINYKGYNDWRLPITPVIAYALDPGVSSSELGHLYLVELGGLPNLSISTNHNSNYNLFTNIQNASYWSGTELVTYVYGTTTPITPNDYAWRFIFGGGQYGVVKNSYYNLWPVRSGDSVSAQTPPVITTTALPNGTFGTPYNAAVGTSSPNGNATTVSVTGLPTNLVFDGVNITGLPQAVGTSNVVITVSDTVTGLVTSATLPLTINDAAMSFAPTTLPDGVTNAPYSATLPAATGGTGSFTYSATGLPAGLTLTGNVISGTPATAGLSTVTLTATDSANTAVSVIVTLNIVDPVIPTACNGNDMAITAFVARNPGYIRLNTNTLPNVFWTTDLTPANTVFLGGAVNWYQTGMIVDYTGTVEPNGSCLLNHLTVKPRVTVSTTSLADATAGLTYSAPVNASWGLPFIAPQAPYNITVSGLPAGLSFDGSNITGTATAIGTSTLTVSAVDSLGFSASKTLTLTVLDQAIGFAPTLPNGTVGTAYSTTLSATGFGPFTYSATGLPAGLTLVGNNINGTPSTAGTYVVALTATDAAGVSQTASATIVINPAATNYTIKDEAIGKISSLGSGFVMVGAKKLVWDANTTIIVNTPAGTRNVIDSFVKVGMKVRWKGLRDKATNTVLTSKMEIN